MKIQSPQFHVVTRTKYAPDAEAEVVELMKRARPILRRQKGLRAARFHKAIAAHEFMSYLTWENAASHEACISSADWHEVNPAWSKLLSSGRVQLEVRVYEELAA